MSEADLSQIQRKRNEAWNRGFIAAQKGEPRNPAMHEYPLSWAAGYDYFFKAGLAGKEG